jgi:hypothetical protein
MPRLNESYNDRPELIAAFVVNTAVYIDDPIGRPSCITPANAGAATVTAGVASPYDDDTADK